MKKTLLFLAIVPLVFTACGSTTSEQTQTNTPTSNQALENTSSASDAYVKPEGWVTITNEEYGFSVDVPAESESLSQTDVSLNFGATRGIAVESFDPNFSIGFSIYEENTQLELLKNPDKGLIEAGGDAFKYFIYARTFDDVDDVVVRDAKVFSDQENELTVDRNFIDINFSGETGSQADIDLVKMIIRSFKKL